MMGRDTGVGNKIGSTKTNCKISCKAKTTTDVCIEKYTCEFTLGQSVIMRDYRGRNDKWIPGTIAERTGPVSYRVQVDDDSLEETSRADCGSQVLVTSKKSLRF